MDPDLPMLELLNALTRCPACDRSPLRSVDNGRTANFLCPACGACWHVGAGRPRRVDPLACPGCGQWATCLQALRRP